MADEKLTELPPEDEKAFQFWYHNWAQEAGINQNPDDPNHFYDYRAAFKAGVSPTINKEDGLYHWPSKFKLEGHPRLFLDGVDTRTGEKVIPNTTIVPNANQFQSKYPNVQTLPDVKAENPTYGDAGLLENYRPGKSIRFKNTKLLNI